MSHEERENQRQQAILESGLTVEHFAPDEVIDSLSGMVEHIETQIESLIKNREDIESKCRSLNLQPRYVKEWNIIELQITRLRKSMKPLKNWYH